MILEEKFQQNPYLSSEEAVNLSRKLQLAVVKIKIWFQNRRARKRREELGEIRTAKSVTTQISNERASITEKDGNVDESEYVNHRAAIPLVYFTDPGVHTLTR